MDDQDKNWPSWRYGPNDAAEIFQSEKDVPAGWQDHPSKVKAAAPAPKPAEKPADPVAKVTPAAPPRKAGRPPKAKTLDL